MSEAPQQRVVAYIDGFNLYYGLREEGTLDRCRWLDLQALARSLLESDRELVFTKYFTSRISGNHLTDSPSRGRAREASRRRQTTYLEALATLSDFERFDGHFHSGPIECEHCGGTWAKFEEKMTDVQIATHLICDAIDDRYDEALLISGDSDLVPAVRAIRQRFQSKRVFVCFPPQRRSLDLTRAANSSKNIPIENFADCQLPQAVKKASGKLLKCPPEWQ